MKGSPKYKRGDTVSFFCSDVHDRDGNVVGKARRVTGIIEIIDAFGAAGCSDVSYDIFEAETNTLWKHVEENEVQKEEEN